MEKGLLPLGSVVTVKGIENLKFMIIGYSLAENSDSTIWNYGGYLHPEGAKSPDQLLLFNHDSINQVFFIGFQSKLGEVYIENLLEARS